jgi:hypothetical protein
MQILINDLLAFSRVGRMGREPELIDADDLVTSAKVNLAAGIEETGAPRSRWTATCRSCTASGRS